MTSPYSSSLLAEPAQQHPRPQAAPAPYAAPPAPAPVMYAQPPVMPQLVMAAPRRSSNIGLGLVALLTVLLAGVAGYAISRASAPSVEETARYQALAAQEGYFQGQQSGRAAGRSAALAQQREVARLRAAIARQRQYNAGYRAGRRAAAYRRSYSRPYYGGGYRAPRLYRYDGGTAAAVNNAVAAAQNWATISGAPVSIDVVR